MIAEHLFVELADMKPLKPVQAEQAYVELLDMKQVKLVIHNPAVHMNEEHDDHQQQLLQHDYDVHEQI